jgi:hypothetical protein
MSTEIMVVCDMITIELAQWRWFGHDVRMRDERQANLKKDRQASTQGRIQTGLGRRDTEGFEGRRN